MSETVKAQLLIDWVIVYKQDTVTGMIISQVNSFTRLAQP